MKKEFNPRYVAFCKAIGRDPAELSERDEEDNIKEIDGLPWTVQFMFWNDQRLLEFCEEKGLGRRSPELAPALDHGGLYDIWLERRVDSLVEEQ